MQNLIDIVIKEIYDTYPDDTIMGDTLYNKWIDLLEMGELTTVAEVYKSMRDSFPGVQPGQIKGHPLQLRYRWMKLIKNALTLRLNPGLKTWEEVESQALPYSLNGTMDQQKQYYDLFGSYGLKEYFLFSLVGNVYYPKP